jgi:hypothetical protein
MTADLTLQTVNELLIAMEVDGYDGFLIEGVVDASVTTILGDSFLGKTYMALDIARSLLTGEPFLGRKIVKQVDGISFLCTDPGGKYDLAGRVRDAGLDNKRIMATSFYAPRDLDGWQDAIKAFRNHGVGAVVIDNTTDLADDANGPREVKAVTDGLRLWCDNGLSVINIHHLNKGGPYGRSGLGSVIWRKWTRAELTLTGNPAKPARKLVALPNNAPATDFSLMFDPAGSPAFTKTAEAGSLERERKRSKDTLDHNLRMSRWVVQHCQGDNTSMVSRKLAEEFGGKDESHRRQINRNAYPLHHDGKGSWSLAET